MEKFTLNPRLENDCNLVGKLELSQILLMDNSLLPWFILVPERSETEMTDLDQSDQLILLKEKNIYNIISCND